CVGGLLNHALVGYGLACQPLRCTVCHGDPTRHHVDITNSLPQGSCVGGLLNHALVGYGLACQLSTPHTGVTL
ncbi:MAG: hypothetical protein WCL44_09580, partial [bacterium]